MFDKPYVVIPTYNEKENITKIIPALFTLSIPHLEILVVDDSSPDGTSEKVEEMQKTYPRLNLLTRPKKEGLGRAYVAGLREALDRGADCIVQMDADFSHDPKDLPRLIKAVASADLVIGSRYTPGGRNIDWHLRRYLSQLANRFAYTVLGIPTRDLTSGFKAWRRSCLEAIQPETLRSVGYGFLLETTVRAWKMDFHLEEVPIQIQQRTSGRSKLSRRTIWEAFWLVWYLRLTCKSRCADSRKE